MIQSQPGADPKSNPARPTTASEARPTVVVITTGGTIASRNRGGAVVAADSGDDLVSRVASDVGVDLQVREVARLGSYQLGLGDLRRISEQVAATWREVPQAVGVVITHGTDTLEETAFLLDLVHAGDQPVVVTGAMRNADDPRSDGPGNLAAAVAVAASGQARGRGVLICFAGRIIAAKGARKRHTVDDDAFDSRWPAGLLGGVDAGVPRFDVAAPVERRAHFPLPSAHFDDLRIDVVSSYPGADGRLVRAAADSGSHGLVLLGTGAGNASPGVFSAVTDFLVGGRPVLVATRVPNGPVVPVYGNGGGASLAAAGAVLVRELPASQARILLGLALLADRRRAAAIVADYLAQELPDNQE